MREIKFRGRRIDNGEWVLGCLVVDPDLQQYMITGIEYYNGETSLEREIFHYEVNPETVGQYTGLKDRNGKEIYEGDVLHFEDGVRLQYVKWSDWMAGFVTVIHENSGSTDIPSNCQVIGNLHELPHLLKGEEA